jgi:hypothetical protein
MQPKDTNTVLNELLVILHRSLPMYISDATPWVAYGSEQAQQALNRLVADSRESSARISALLAERRHTIELGEFPMTFTGLHDVSLDYLIEHLIVHQKRDLHRIEALSQRLAGDLEGQAVARQVLANVQGHVEALEALQAQPTGAKR